MLQRLRTFITVTDMNSFSKAARALNISQPAVSKQIAVLERYYGTPLYERDAHELALTRCGSLLYDHAVSLLTAAASMDASVKELAHTLIGTLHIGASTIPGHYILPRLLGDFIRACPTIIPTVTTGDTAQVSTRLLTGKLDVVVVGAAITDSGVVCRPLFSDQIVLITPLDHPFSTRKSIAAAELSGQPYIDRERGSATRKIVTTALGDSGRFITPIMELDSTEAIVNAVSSGAGISFVSRWAILDHAPTRCHFLTIDDVCLHRHIYCCHLRAAENLPTINLLYEFTRSHAPRLPGDTNE